MSPLEEYTHRLGQRETQVLRRQREHERFGYARLLIAAGGVFVLWSSLWRHTISPWWIVAPAIAYALTAIVHGRVLRAKECAERAADVYRRGIARIEDRWGSLHNPGTTETGERFADPHHVYAADLDLFGRDSLFELLSTARTRMGEERLAAWLLHPATVADILARHEALRELAPQLDFREDLAVLGEDARTGVHPDALIAWAESDEGLPPAVRVVAPLLALLAIATAMLWGGWGIAWPFGVVLLANAALILSLRRRLEMLLAKTGRAFDDIELLEQIAERIEHEQFSSQTLRDLVARLRSHDVPASRAMKRFGLIADMVRSRESLLLRTLDWPLLYSVNMGYVAESWRRRHGAMVRTWINAVAEMEALLSLATYHYEHPADVLPEFIIVEGSRASLKVRALGHPLIPAATCVRNEVSIGHDAPVLLVSGSNMSGKSTLLRSVGVNVVLAMAGAPVRATAMRLTPLQVGASIRINDSLHEGSSRFYAEVKRLRDILDLAGRKPNLLFLLDEFLQGTNSQDRRIGAEGALRALVERGAIGLISTHDLALTAVSGGNHWAHNVHFQDEFVGGEMRFDYKLREGVVTKSNGLELMRALGIKV